MAKKKKIGWIQRLICAVGIGAILIVAVTVERPERSVARDPKEARIAKRQHALTVEGIASKNVDGNGRYFFRISNNDELPFVGQVKIQVFSDSYSRQMGHSDFGVTDSVAPGKRQVVFVDSAVLPKSAVGGNGVSKFRFTATNEAGEIAASGSGAVGKFVASGDGETVP